MNRSILLVEDNDDDVFFMKNAFKKNGVVQPLQVARDGQEAIDFLEAAQQAGTNIPCLILLDLKMPRVPGLEVLDWIRHQPQLRLLPIVVLTSSSADADVQAAYERGANSYFAKPADHNELHKLVKLLDEYWLKRCLPPPQCRKTQPEPPGAN